MTEGTIHVMKTPPRSELVSTIQESFQVLLLSGRWALSNGNSQTRNAHYFNKVSFQASLFIKPLSKHGFTEVRRSMISAE